MDSLRSSTPRSPGTVAVSGGIFALAAATLMYEVLLTRIFSVTMWYHFAFLAVAAALCGMTAGAILVQAYPEAFPRGRAAHYRLGAAALVFALTVPLTFLAHLAIPLRPSLTPTGLASVLLTYGLVAIPFVASGVAICIALTRLDRPVGLVYAADLAGAAVGCVATVAALRVADAPTAVFFVAVLGAASALVFAVAARQPGVAAGSLGLALLALIVVVARPGWVRPVWVKGSPEVGPTLHERWNSYSRIRITGDPVALTPPFGWGLSERYPRDHPKSQLLLSIDAIADTVLTRFDGDLAAIDHLRYDVTNLAHYLRRDARVLVVGAGGGRDVLSALAFGQKEVLAVEVNDAILDAVNGRFGDYTGHLDRRPGVRFVHDEARSYVQRLDQRFDVIQVSFIDTFAATAAGAYVLTEHSLYTREAWRTFLDRLQPDGILTYSRWYFHQSPAEIQRLVALAVAALGDAGVAQPGDHLLLVRNRTGADPRYRDKIGVGTLLVGRRPFSPEELATARAVSDRLGFEVVLAPDGSSDPALAALTSPDGLAAAVADSPLDISPPTDDRPFFFHTTPLTGALTLRGADQGNVSFNVAAILVLVGALGVLSGLVAVCFAWPLGRPGLRGPPGRARDGLFFAAIGLGYIMVEMAQLQRLSVFLGHPTYGLVVVLFALLLASGLGSLAMSRTPTGPPRVADAWPLLVLPGVLAVSGVVTPAVTVALRAEPTPIRVATAVGLLVPMGLVMGTAFPRGLQLALRGAPESGPWLWAINGATSVLGSVVAVLVSISAGITVTFWTAVAAYAVAAGLATLMASAEGRAPARAPLTGSGRSRLPVTRESAGIISDRRKASRQDSKRRDS